MNLDLPDLRLLHAFGNEEVLLQKVAGGGALAARVAVGLMEANRSLNSRRREEMLAAQAERMNHAFRMMEDANMAPVREHARHTRMPLILMAMQARHTGGMGIGAPLQGAPRMITGEDVPLGMDEGMVRMASAIGRDLATYSLEKDAGIGRVIGSMGNTIKAFAGAAPKAVGTFGRSFRNIRSGGSGVAGGNTMGAAFSGALDKAKNTFTSQARGSLRQMQRTDLAKQTQQAAQAARSSSLQNVNPALRQRFEASQAAKGLDPTQVQAPVKGTLQKATNPNARAQGLARAESMTPEQKMQARIDRRSGKLQSPGQQSPVGGQVAPQQAAQQSPVTAPAPKPALQPAPAQQPVQQPAQQAPAAAAPAAPAGADGQAPGAPKGEGFDLQKAWDRTGLSNNRWKWKLPALAAGAAGAGLLYAGAKKGFEVLGQEPAPARYNQGGATPAYGVNQYGVADRSTSFM